MSNAWCRVHVVIVCFVVMPCIGTGTAVGAGDVVHLPGVPTYPGSEVAPEIYDDAVFYTADAEDEHVHDYYRAELSAKGWECYRTETASYFVKDDRGFELFMTDGDINYYLLDPALARARGVALDKDQYIDKVVGFAAKLKPYHRSLEEKQQQFDAAEGEAKMAALDTLMAAQERIDAAIEEIGPIVGATLDRLSDFNEEYALDLMTYLQAHPDLKNQGVPEMLTRLEYWDTLGSLVEGQAEEHPEEAEVFLESYMSFMGEWAQF